MQSSVDPTYVHRDKICTPRTPVAVNGVRLKWYDIAAPEAGVPADIHAMARAFVEGLKVEGELGFVVLHRCGADFYFLLVQTWRFENEIWESVYSKSADDTGFTLPARPGPHRPTFCVWELGAVIHEQQAWKRFLISPRDEAAKEAYLADRFEGAV